VTIELPAYVTTKNTMKTSLETVIDLKSHESLFPWTHVSNLPLGLLQKTIDKMEECVSKLKPDSSPEEMSKLKKDCTTFGDTLRGFQSAKTRNPKLTSC
jgi:hypothetical protein